MKSGFGREFLNALLITLGILSAGLGLKGFLLPSGFIDGGVTGTEIAALLISKRSTLLRVGDVILGFNVVLFLVAMAVLGVENALYSILTYLTAARTLDFVIHGIEEYTAMTIVSGRKARSSCRTRCRTSRAGSSKREPVACSW